MSASGVGTVESTLPAASRMAPSLWRSHRRPKYPSEGAAQLPDGVPHDSPTVRGRLSSANRTPVSRPMAFAMRALLPVRHAEHAHVEPEVARHRRAMSRGDGLDRRARREARDDDPRLERRDLGEGSGGRGTTTTVGLGQRKRSIHT
jgi:hypothetical protein